MICWLSQISFNKNRVFFFHLDFWVLVFSMSVVRFLYDNCKISRFFFIPIFEFKPSISTMSIIDCQLLRQKVCQIISLIKTKTCVFVVFKTKPELKCQNELFHFSRYSVFLFSLLTEIIWRNNWQSIIDLVERLS